MSSENRRLREDDKEECGAVVCLFAMMLAAPRRPSDAALPRLRRRRQPAFLEVILGTDDCPYKRELDVSSRHRPTGRLVGVAGRARARLHA